MNAPAKINTLPRPLPPSRDREIYKPIVDKFLPGLSDEERELHAAIMLIRDNAFSAMRRAGPDDYDVLDTVHRIAVQHCFQRKPIEDLTELRKLLVQLVSIANGFQALNRTEDGDARG